jgi:hypothetical protein
MYNNKKHIQLNCTLTAADSLSLLLSVMTCELFVANTACEMPVHVDEQDQSALEQVANCGGRGLNEDMRDRYYLYYSLFIVLVLLLYERAVTTSTVFVTVWMWSVLLMSALVQWSTASMAFVCVCATTCVTAV